MWSITKLDNKFSSTWKKVRSVASSPLAGKRMKQGQPKISQTNGVKIALSSISPNLVNLYFSSDTSSISMPIDFACFVKKFYACFTRFNFITNLSYKK